MRAPIIGVVGAGRCDAPTEALAAEVGRQIARSGAALVCGGLEGVMRGAARGAREAGGRTIGILPGASTDEANPFIEIPIATNMGQARNVIIVQTADVLIAVSGGYGTLSEIALALKLGKTVIALRPEIEVPGVTPAETAEQAVEKAIECLRPSPPEANA